MRVLVLSYLTSNEALNLYYNCRNSIMVEHGTQYSMEHQAWSCVWRIGQLQTQHTTRLVNHTMIHLLIENSLRMKQSPMQYALGVYQKAPSEAIDLDADPLYDTVFGKISPQAIQSAVIGQYNHEIIHVR